MQKTSSYAKAYVEILEIINNNRNNIYENKKLV